MTEKSLKRIDIENLEILDKLFGNLDENVKTIEKHFNVNLVSRNGSIEIMGDKEPLSIATKVILKLVSLIKKGEIIDKQKLVYTISLFDKGQGDVIDDILEDTVCVTARGKMIKPKTMGQHRYIQAIKEKDVVFGVGPAGTGKSYLAVAMAVKAFKNKEVNKIILTRPAVEAGENLGFLPGDLQSKVDPYLRPLYDALYDILGAETYLKLKEKNMIEIAPLAYMRGRTLDDSFIILDEAQNTTIAQMKMFLTRIGFGSQAVINGDITQIDLPRGKQSGLEHAIDVLKNINGIAFSYFDKNDVVRHSLVQKIINAYEKYENKTNKDRINKKPTHNKGGNKHKSNK